MRSREAARRPGRGRRCAARAPAARRRRRWRRRRRAGPRPGSPRGRARSRPPRAGSRRSPSSPSGGSKRAALGLRPRRRRRRRRSRRRSPRRRCRDGPRARSPATSISSLESASSKRWSAAKRPATIAAALEPRPRASGISLRSRKAIPSAGCRLSKARTIRLSRPVGTSSAAGVEARTRRSPRPRARGRARPPPPSRRSPARGWPRRRGRGRVGGGAVISRTPRARPR